MVRKIKKKNGIAMIELIFALVVMGIVLMSAPMLIQQSIKSSNVALQQEAIVAAASQTAIVLSMHWDENNTQSGASAILNTGGASSSGTTGSGNHNNHHNNNNSHHTSFQPIGLDGVFGRTTSNGVSSLTPSINFGADDVNESNDHTKFDDVDDYDGSTFGLMLFNTESTTADVGEYVDTNININTNVRYTQDNNVSDDIPAGTLFSNIKAISVNLTSNTVNTPELEKNITFEAFSCNIGTYSISGRELP